MKTPLFPPRCARSAVAALAIPVFAAAARGDEVADLRQMVQEMQKTITGLQARISDLEKPRASLPPASAAMWPAAPPSGAKQVAAPPPDPRYKGYVALPSTPFLVRFNFKPRLDLTVDSQHPGNRYRFVPARIPLEGTLQHGGGEEFNLNANGTQIDIDVRAPELPGNFRLHYQNDFFGSDTSDMRYRLRHAYGEYYNFTAGFTYGIFEDPDGWPDTLDYEGNNAVVFARRAVIHYRIPLSEHWQLTLGVEKPDTYIDNNFDATISRQTRAPDGGFNLRWEQSDVGHVQLSAIFRSVGAKGETVGEQKVLGWGVNASAGFHLTERDLFQAWVVYGEGIGGMGNDSGFESTDAAFDENGKLQALRYFSGLVGYTHEWNDDWRSTLSYGYVNVANTSGQAADAYHVTHYGSANLIYRIDDHFSIGVEGLYGRREVRDGRIGEDFRLQLSFLYSMF